MGVGAVMLCDRRVMGVEGRWPSLAYEVELAGRLFGAAGHRRVADWVDQEVALVDNSDFANEFAAHVNLPGVANCSLNTAR